MPAAGRSLPAYLPVKRFAAICLVALKRNMHWQVRASFCVKPADDLDHSDASPPYVKCVPLPPDEILAGAQHVTHT